MMEQVTEKEILRKKVEDLEEHLHKKTEEVEFLRNEIEDIRWRNVQRLMEEDRKRNASLYEYMERAELRSPGRCAIL